MWVGSRSRVTTDESTTHRQKIKLRFTRLNRETRIHLGGSHTIPLQPGCYAKKYKTGSKVHRILRISKKTDRRTPLRVAHVISTKQRYDTAGKLRTRIIGTQSRVTPSPENSRVQPEILRPFGHRCMDGRARPSARDRGPTYGDLEFRNAQRAHEKTCNRVFNKLRQLIST